MKVRIVQSVIPEYRDPFFRRIAAQPGIELEVWADLEEGTGSLKNAPDRGGYRRVHAPNRVVGPLLWQPALLDAVNGEAEVVVAQWNARLAHLFPAIRKARRHGVRLVLWGHGMGKRESATRRAIRNALGKRADAVILYTPGVAAELRDAGFDPRRLHVAPNSLNLDPIEAARRAWPAERVRSFLAERGCEPGRTVLFVSRLEPDKRVDLLLEAMAALAGDHPELRTCIIGGGPERPQLEALAGRLGISSTVRFEGPVYTEANLAPWFLGSMCMGYPGPIGLSLLHAFAYGLPVIAHDRRINHGPEIEALRPGENGLLFTEGDPRTLADAIASLHKDDERRRRMSDAARSAVRDDGPWSMDAMVRGFTAAIRGEPAGGP
jgi:glycosyltransferase involved in cell wall biosynthesis